MTKKQKAKALNVEILPAQESELSPEFAVRLENSYLDAVSGMQKVLTFGMLCMIAKEYAPHGAFRKWVEDNCPRIAYKTALQFRHLTELILDACGTKVLQLQNFEIEPEKLFTTPRKQLPEKLGKFRDTLEQVIEHKSQYQLELEFGIRKPRKGKLVGKGNTNNPDGNNGWEARRDPFKSQEAAWQFLFGSRDAGLIGDGSLLGDVRMIRRKPIWENLPLPAKVKMVEELQGLSNDIESSYKDVINDVKKAEKTAARRAKKASSK